MFFIIPYLRFQVRGEGEKKRYVVCWIPCVFFFCLDGEEEKRKKKARVGKMWWGGGAWFILPNLKFDSHLLYHLLFDPIVTFCFFFFWGGVHSFVHEGDDDDDDNFSTASTDRTFDDNLTIRKFVKLKIIYIFVCNFYKGEKLGGRREEMRRRKKNYIWHLPGQRVLTRFRSGKQMSCAAGERKKIKKKRNSKALL